MIDKRIIQAMAKAERMMDEGKIPFVMAPGPRGGLDRMALTPEVMEEFQLKQGQTINALIRDAIIEFLLGDTLEKVKSVLKNQIEKEQEEDAEEVESKLSEDFDFRNMLGDEDGTTKH